MSSRASILELFEVGYSLDNGSGEFLFEGISMGLGYRRYGLVGRNGVGKTTLVKIIMQELESSEGTVRVFGNVGYLAQNEGELESLSGGELTQLKLAKAVKGDPDLLILDEPTNHLDREARERLYAFVRGYKKGLLLISHDRELLGLMDEIIEMSSLGVRCYGGNYEDYREKKQEEVESAESEYASACDQLKKKKRQIQEKRERKDRKDARGRAIRKTGLVPRIELNAKQGRAEKTQARMNKELIRQEEEAQRKKKEAFEKIEMAGKLRIDLSRTAIGSGKQVLKCENVGYCYPRTEDGVLKGVSFELVGPERVGLVGGNGSGKSTLLKVILGELEASEGTVEIKVDSVGYLDQRVGFLNEEETVLENFRRFNRGMSETEVRYALARFLFPNREALKRVSVLSGGERVRLGLACQLMAEKPRQLLILDEPTNHLDLDSVEAVESALREYRGALLVVSHDDRFMENIGVGRWIDLGNKPSPTLR